MKKMAYKGIERLFQLIGSDPLYDYRYGFFTTEKSQYCYIRLSFNEDSPLRHSGISPELIVSTIREAEDESGVRHYEAKTYAFPSLKDKDFDEKGTSWFFQIQDRELLELVSADYIKAVALWQCGRLVLDMYKDSPDTWMEFFRAGVAQCINGEQNSYELTVFCVSYFQAWMGNRLSIVCRMERWGAEEMASGLEAPEKACIGIMDKIKNCM